MNNDLSKQLQAQVRLAFEKKSPVRVTAGDSKSFYGNNVVGNKLDIRDHTGIIDYHPSELVLTARCGTKLSEIEKTLKDNNQMLAFEPPSHTVNATFGGAIATGLSGPRRVSSGSVRDFVLGTRIINGKAEILQFGGQVMKNVAGYDASRLMVGAQGTLGVLLDISVKVLPIPETEQTLSLVMDELSAINQLRTWVNQGHPITASCHFNNTLFIRLSGTQNSVIHAARNISNDKSDADIWQRLRNQSHEFFQQNNLWRVSVPPACKAITSDYEQLIEWSGALRWIVSENDLFETAQQHNGHATRYTLNETSSQNCFQPLSQPIMALHKRIKQSFDPENILNPERTYKNL